MNGAATGGKCPPLSKSGRELRGAQQFCPSWDGSLGTQKMATWADTHTPTCTAAPFHVEVKVEATHVSINEEKQNVTSPYN